MKTTSVHLKLALALTLLISHSANAALLARWSFNEQSGTFASDSTGSFPGTLSPDGATFVADGISGGAISLSRAANGFVNMGNVLGLTSGDFSLVIWMKMTAGDSSPDTVILSKHAAYSRNGYYLHVNSQSGGLVDSANRVFFFEGGSGFSAITPGETPVSTATVNDGSWHQVVAVYQAGGVKSIYVDGAPAEASKASQSFGGNAAAFMIGGINYNGVPTGLFTGLIDEVQIYNHALTDNDIDFLFQNPAQALCTQRASATAVLENGLVVGANIVDSGCGYTSAPLVLIQGGGGTGATATATVSNGIVTAINITSAGCCYTNIPIIVIASPPFAPTVDIKVSKVKVTQHVVLGRNYILESSTNLVEWNPTGPQFTADSELIEAEFEVDVMGRYFRLREVP